MHGEHFVLVDGHRQIRGYFTSDPEGLTRLKAAMSALLADKAS